MALKPCRECGKDVSEEAKTCPSCGLNQPTKLPPKKFEEMSPTEKYFTIGKSLGVIGGVLTFFASFALGAGIIVSFVAACVIGALTYPLWPATILVIIYLFFAG